VFAAIRRDRIQAAEAEILASLEEKERTFADCWYSEAARGRLKAAMEEF